MRKVRALGVYGGSRPLTENGVPVLPVENFLRLRWDDEVF